MEDKYIIKLQGKEFVTFEGLLKEFHNEGGKSINTQIISTNPLIIQATVTGPKGIFQGMGDSNEENTNKLVSKHKIRMAETRGIARALRFYCNIGSCSVEELGDGDIKELKEVKINTFGEEVPVSNECSKCGSNVDDKVKDYSIKFFKKVLCLTCQKEVKN